MNFEEEKNKSKSAFVADIAEVLISMDNKVCSVKDLAKAYKLKFKTNVNVVIDKLDERNFKNEKARNIWNFLRFHCQEFCDVFQNDGEYRVLRTLDEKTEEQKGNNIKKKPKKQTKAAPKLNFGRIGSMSLPRLNPQGFAKTSTKASIPTVACTNSNYAATYRSADQLHGFEKQDDKSSDESSDEQNRFETSKELLKMRSFEQGIADQKKAAQYFQEPNAAPSVFNPFHFPSLSPKNSLEICDKESESKNITNIAQVMEKNSSNSQQSCTYKVNIDNPIFCMLFPEVIIDATEKLPQSKFLNLDKKLVFEVTLLIIHSPSQFWFQYSSNDSISIRMNLFYTDTWSENLAIDQQSTYPGLVAAKLCDVWRRAQFIGKSQTKDEICLFFVDVGIRKFVRNTDVRYLLKSFANEPSQALRGSLAGVCPKHEDWSYENQTFFFNIVAEKKFFATICYYHKIEDVYELALSQYASSLSDDIASILTHKGFADRVEIKGSSFSIPTAF